MAELRKRAASALQFYNLVGIAAYSVSPSTAYKAACDLDWWHDKALSCRHLAMILRDYGFEAFEKVVLEEAPDIYNDLCLCDCHLQDYELDDFWENPVDVEDCDCDCCDHNECFHAAHEFDYECPICDSSEDEKDGDDDQEEAERDYIISECRCRPSTPTFASACSDPYCRNNPKKIPPAGVRVIYIGDENREDVPISDESGLLEDDSASHHIEPERKVYDTQPPLPEPRNRLERIACRLQQITGTRYPVKVVTSNEPNAYADGTSIGVTTSASQLLDDDEMAWVMSHEIVHNINQDPPKKTQRTLELFDDVSNAIANKEGGVIGNIVTAGVIGVVDHAINRRDDRQEERVADQIAKDIMKQAGYNAAKAARAMEKIANKENEGGIFSTHPAAEERIERLKE